MFDYHLIDFICGDLSLLHVDIEIKVPYKKLHLPKKGITHTCTVGSLSLW